MNIRKINGFTVQLVADGVYAIDEFGIALMQRHGRGRCGKHHGNARSV